MRKLFIALSMLFLPLNAAHAEVHVGVGISVPGVSIGINLPAYPRMVRVPGYPVYYSPAVNLNYFFYDGLYWVFQGDNWYVSSWYNGPWEWVGRDYVPLMCCRFRCATTVSRRRIFVAGGPMLPRAGVITGGASGSSAATNGIRQIAMQRLPPHPHRCRAISGIIRESAIRERLISNIRFEPNVTAISRVKR